MSHIPYFGQLEDSSIQIEDQISRLELAVSTYAAVSPGQSITFNSAQSVEQRLYDLIHFFEEEL